MIARRTPSAPLWIAAFSIALVAFAASLAAGTVLVAGELDGGAQAELETSAGAPPLQAAAPSNDPSPSPAVVEDGQLTYFGMLPAAAATRAGIIAVSDPSGADLVVEPAPDGPVVRWWAPVASLHAGVDAMTSAELAAATAGSSFVLATVSGAIPPGAGSLGTPTRDFATYEALFAALASPLEPPMVALVPFEELRAGGVALAVDGMDPVREQAETLGWPFVERVAVTANTPEGELALADVLIELESPAPAPIRVAITGDILQSRCSLAQIETTGDWASALRGEMAGYLAGAHLAFGTLDGSLQDINEPYRCVETTNLSSPPQVVEALTLAGFDGLSVASNHVFDCGSGYCADQAFRQTLEVLAGAGISAVGGGFNLEAALAPAVFEAGGVRFGVLAFDDIAAEDYQATASAPGTSPMDDSYDNERSTPPQEPAFYKPAELLGVERLTERVRLLSGQVDIVIVLAQTGTEDTHDPSPRSIKALRAAAEAGATLVVGNQAHWVQAHELHGGAYVAYALGNFIFDQRHTVEHTEGFVLEATFHGPRLVTTRLLPYRIVDQYRPTFVAGEERDKVLRDAAEASRRLLSRP